MAPEIVIQNDVRLRDFFRSFVENYNPLFAMGLLGFASLMERKNDSSTKTAILYAKSDGLIFYGLDLLTTYPHLKAAEAINGNRVQVFHAATSSDLEEVLADNSFQNLVIKGHGNKYGWDATDRYFSVDDLDEIDFQPKTGEVLKLTCSGIGPDQFALRMVSDPSNATYFQQEPTNGQFQKFIRSRLYNNGA